MESSVCPSFEANNEIQGVLTADWKQAMDQAWICHLGFRSSRENYEQFWNEMETNERIEISSTIKWSSLPRGRGIGMKPSVDNKKLSLVSGSKENAKMNAKSSQIFDDRPHYWSCIFCGLCFDIPILAQPKITSQKKKYRGNSRAFCHMSCHV